MNLSRLAGRDRDVRSRLVCWSSAEILRDSCESLVQQTMMSTCPDPQVFLEDNCLFSRMTAAEVRTSSRGRPVSPSTFPSRFWRMTHSKREPFVMGLGNFPLLRSDAPQSREQSAVTPRSGEFPRKRTDIQSLNKSFVLVPNLLMKEFRPK